MDDDIETRLDKLEGDLHDLIKTKNKASEALDYTKAEKAQKQIEELKVQIKQLKKVDLKKNHNMEVI